MNNSHPSHSSFSLDDDGLETHRKSVHSRLKNYIGDVAPFSLEKQDEPAGKEDPEVVYMNCRSRPRYVFSGEDIVKISMPPGSRVIYAKPPLRPLQDVAGAIRYALHHPESDDQEQKPLPELVTKDSQVTIAVDDISLPLPAMVDPDLRQTMLEVVLDELDRVGVQDIHIIIATAFHRRMTTAEIRKMVGRPVFQKYYPDRLYNHDGENKAQMKWLGHTEMGEKVEINRRAAESDLLMYLNINFVPMNGGSKSVATGLAGYSTLREHHDPEVIAASNSYMDVHRSALADSNQRINDVIKKKVPVFHVETAVNNRMYYPPFDILSCNEDTLSSVEFLFLQGLKKSLDRLSAKLKRRIFQKIPAAYQCVAVHAGAVHGVHKKIIEKSYQQYEVRVKKQADILAVGIPYVCPYSVNSVLNPLLVQVMGLGYIYHLFTGGRPLVRDGGTLILFHPCRDEFDERFHPSYIEFFHRLLPESTDSTFLQKNYEEEFAKDPDYIRLYREDHAYHGVHPFYMWYWGESGRRRLQKIILVGAKDPQVPERMGWCHAKNFEDALQMADYRPSSDSAGLSSESSGSQLTLLHLPPMLITKIIGE